MSGKFDRSKIRGSKIASIQKAQGEAKKNEKYFGDSSGRVNYHKIGDGKNVFRVAPVLEDGAVPYEPYYSTFLQCLVDEYSEGEKTGNKVVKNKKVFIATQHSPKNKKGDPIVSKDPVLTYIDFVYKLAEEKFDQDKDGKSKFLNPITGYRAGGKWTSGIRPSMEYVCYAWDSENKLGQLGLNNAWMKKMEKISLELSDEDVLALDVFSDAENGYPLIIRKGKNEKTNKTEYDISAEQLKRGEDWDEFFKKNRITDDQLFELDKLDSLKSRFQGAYSQRDFDLAIDGLKRFDEEHSYGIFSDEAFLDVLEEIAATVPEDPKKEENDTKEGKDIEETFNKEKESEEVTPIRMKKFLRKYIADEYGEDYELPSIKGAELKKWYQLALDGEELPFPESSNETEEEEDTTEGESELNESDADTDVDANIDLKARLAKMAKNRGK